MSPRAPHLNRSTCAHDWPGFKVTISAPRLNVKTFVFRSQSRRFPALRRLSSLWPVTTPRTTHPAAIPRTVPDPADNSRAIPTHPPTRKRTRPHRPIRQPAGTGRAAASRSLELISLPHRLASLLPGAPLTPSESHLLKPPETRPFGFIAKS